MGDGINDASALHAADVGISVDSAVDVAKDAADIVLLEKDLGVLVQGVREGRATFANTLKYVFMATSANFGNMFSMAGVSLVLPFLPLLPKQILLTNLLTDFPEMTIATDSVDNEMVDHPRRWNIKAIRQFMITFGIVSSVFDFLTFGALLLYPACHAGSIQNRLVSGVRCFSLLDRSRYSKPQTVLQKSTREIPLKGNPVNCPRDVGCTFHPACSGFWIRPAANSVPLAHRDHCVALHHHRGSLEEGLLQKGEGVKGNVPKVKSDCLRQLIRKKWPARCSPISPSASRKTTCEIQCCCRHYRR